MSEIRVGIIGVGGAGRAHLKRFNIDGRARVTALYDTKQRRPYAGIEIEQNLVAFLDKVDAVSVCTPDQDHLAYCVAALQAGKHVLVEKPMVGSVDQARALRPAVEAHRDLVFGVHHQMRYVPAFETTKSAVLRGELGPVFAIEANYWHDMRERAALYDDWRVRGKGQSVLFGAACHPLDLMLWLLEGQEVEDFNIYVNHLGYPEYPNYTNLTMLLRFSGGAIGKINANIAVRMRQYNDLVVLAEKGTLVDGWLYTDHWQDLCPFNLPGERHPRLRNVFWRLVDRLGARSMHFRRPMFSRYDHDAACRRIVSNFVSAIRGEESILVPFEEGFRIVALMARMEEEAEVQSQGTWQG